MANVLGGAARYVTDQSLKRYKRQLITIIWVSCFFSFFLGSFMGLSLTRLPYSWITFFIFIGGILIVAILTDKVSGKLEKERIDFRKGATGEELVSYILREDLPADYVVINGLKPKKRSGDIDHIVVGPTGVYAIDTKNWKGIVAADGKGELLLNGRPTQKAIKNLTRTIMTIKEKIKARSALDPYIRGVLAFPSARVEAKWGTTGAVHCVTDEKLYDYIVENKKGKKLTKKDIESISQPFLALARMDKDFAPDSK